MAMISLEFVCDIVAFVFDLLPQSSDSVFISKKKKVMFKCYFA